MLGHRVSAVEGTVCIVVYSPIGSGRRFFKVLCGCKRKIGSVR